MGESSQALEGGWTLGAFENAVWYWDVSGNGSYGAGDFETGTNPPWFGAATDTVLIGAGFHSCGGGGGDIGTYRPSSREFFLDLDGNRIWDNAIDRKITGFLPAAAGFTDQPFIFNVIAGGPVEFRDCRGVIGYFRTPNAGGAGTWYIDRNNNGVWDGAVVEPTATWGSTGEIAVPVSRNGFGSRLSVFRPSTGQWFIDDGDGVWEGCGLDACPFFGDTSSTGAFANPNGCALGTFKNTTTRVDTDCDGISEVDEVFTWGLSTSQRFLF